MAPKKAAASKEKETKKKEAPSKASAPKKKGKEVDEVELARQKELQASENEEADDADEFADESASSGGGSNPGVNPAEMSASFKNFRHHPDMENFYRFIFENDLRQEALEILDVIVQEKQLKKAQKSTSGKSKH